MIAMASWIENWLGAALGIALGIAFIYWDFYGFFKR